MSISNNNLETIKQFGINGLEAARTLGELNLRTWERLVEKQTETLGLFVNAGIELVKVTSDQKDIQELVNAEMGVARQFGESLVVKGRETLQVANDARDDYRLWAEQGVEQFTQQVKKSA